MIKELREKTLFILTSILFFVLPENILKTYIYITVAVLIHKLKFNSIHMEKLDHTKFKSVLHITLNNDVMLFPEYTCKFIWSDQALTKTIMVKGKTYTVKEIISNDDMLKLNVSKVVDVLYSLMPRNIKIKLSKFSRGKESGVKHELSEVILFSI